MKKIINAYTVQLLKENSIYFASLVIFILLAALVIPWQISGYSVTKEENQKLTEEIGRLENKIKIVVAFDSDEIDRLIAVLNTILPQTEDYFSIYPVLNALSQQTSFIVTGFKIEFNQVLPEKLTLDITAEGSPEAFVTFLENYTYHGGRLITIDEITYEPGSAPQSLKLNFYSKKIETVEPQTVPVIDKKRIDLVRRISDDLSDILASQPASIDTNYPVRENPFGSL